MRGRLLLFLPAAVALVVAVVALGDARTVVVGAAVPLVAAVVALVLAAAAAAAVLWMRSRSRAAERARAAAAEDAAREHRRFLDRLDHELKNPVTAIRAAVAASTPSTPQLDVIDGQTERLARLVGDLRKLAELRTIALEAASVDVDTLVGDVVDAVRDAHGREIAVTLPSAPWPLPRVAGDPDLLFVAVFNVVANAAKYSEPGDTIEVRGSERDGTVVLEVADTGRGIPEAELGTVFEELARASNARDRQGSGLGLALVRTIVERHGGGADITSREGQGTSVRITLPAVRH
ncbi:sensor histidine kinase [Microbacterium sp.]|uniref:sensor histidine kinase n=1 Tax=Microbacterium sp. TaxID=51671 RepID=UPI0039E3E289